MDPSVLRFEVEPPDSAELREFLRHAGALLAASDVKCPQRANVLKRARAWVLATLYGIDESLRALGPEAVPLEIVDCQTEPHQTPDEILIPTLARSRRSK